ncbi:sodium channel protein type 9 subunit alpha [Striga asiatica]|uniref:Sodium channel protein type 9 subunit alpha n=1 Tax=Striga asiatica TaxID=4170 RepID=A0A5A7R8A8_STRAF|nr:sodium channel protein type 9 subunit alpha [Striga asiatica]
MSIQTKTCNVDMNRPIASTATYCPASFAVRSLKTSKTTQLKKKKKDLQNKRENEKKSDKRQVKGTTEYCKKNPANNSFGIANAPRRSSKVNVIPMPSMVTVMPITVHLGWTQSYHPGLNRPNKQPKATHTGKAVEMASPTASIQLFFSAVNALEELLHRRGFGLGTAPKRDAAGETKKGCRKWSWI